VFLCVVTALTPTRASAQPRDEDKAEADRLFYEGRQLLAEDKRVEACVKFDLSFRKDPRAIGTLLNLGLCAEMSGAVATAVRYYAEARDRARDQGLAEYREAAERKVALLAPRVPHARIVLAESRPGTRVLLDNNVLAADQLVDVIVDPGSRTLTVTSPDRLPYETTVEVKEAERRTISVPRLQGARTVIVTASNRRSYGKIAVAVGAGFLLTGGALAWTAQREYWEVFPAGSRDGLAVMDAAHDCWTELDGEDIVRSCNASGSSRLDSSRTMAHAASGFAITGGVAVAAGLLLWWTSPKTSEVTVVPTMSERGGGVSVSGAF
jgi:hypothetical protein